MQTFRSKIDWWILGFIIAMSGLLIQLLLTMYAKGTMQEYPEHTVVYILTIVVLWSPIFTTRYTIQDHVLTIRSLVFKWQIPLANIQKISKTNHSISSPALSLDRLKIEYLKAGEVKQVLVSPKDEKGFCEALQAVNTAMSVK